MAPPVPLITPSTLETQLNHHANNKPRKRTLTLTNCALKELVQYKCNVEQPVKQGVTPAILCQPVVRLFRECANGVHVETTAWEEWKAGQERQKMVERKG
ncbi:hypothetical protein P280DRAFT_411101 [Massarina eburnea CBS 473.64]|uniref:Uncharacterized protein n=1 Tax=Massarina eburnea CBS 473.64 TaxID=1395130 RepID=A0A6A6RJM8_9PLEO|nr:hypothetical protein P280DRAFT_411101 [Massarina eburnea CBS 473.64]